MRRTSISADYVRHYNRSRLRRQAFTIRWYKVKRALVLAIVFAAIGVLLAL